MKKTNLFAVLALAATPAFLHAQTTNYSQVVGYTTTTVKGHGGAASSWFSFLPIQMLKPSVFIGVGSASGTTVTLTGANLTAVGPSAGYPTHFLMIKSGTGAGYFSDVTSFTSTSVTLADDLSSFIASDTSLAVIPHYKLSEVLGTGAGLKIGGGGSVGAADTVQVSDSTGVLKTYYYKTGIGAGWKTSAGADASGVVVYPTDGLLISRKLSSDVSIVQTGEVADNNIKTTFVQGLTAASSGFPTSLTMPDLTSVLAGSGAVGTADNLIVVNPATGKLDTYYYKTGIGAGWKTSSGASANTALDFGQGYIIKRRAAAPATLTQNKTW